MVLLARTLLAEDCPNVLLLTQPNVFYDAEFLQNIDSLRGCAQNLIKIPFMVDNDDMIDTLLQLKSKCFSKSVILLDWQRWEQIKTSEELRILQAFLGLLSLSFGGKENFFATSCYAMLCYAHVCTNTLLYSPLQHKA